MGSPPCIFAELLALFGLLLVFEHRENNACGSNHQQNSVDAVAPHAIVAGPGQLGTAGVDDGQRNNGVCRAVVGIHFHIVAVQRRRGSQKVVRQRLIAVEGAVAGIVLNESEHVGGVDPAGTRRIVRSRDHDTDAVFQQRIAVVRLRFGQDVGVVLKAEDLDRTAGIGNEGRAFAAVLVCGSGNVTGRGGRALDVVDAGFRLLGGHPVAVGRVEYLEIDLGEVAVVVGEFLGQIENVHIQMAIVHERVIVAHIGAFPGQNDAVGVAGVTVDHIGILIDGAGVGDPQEAGAVAQLHNGSAVTGGSAVVDLVESGGGRADDHTGAVVGQGLAALRKRRLIGHAELRSLIGELPGGDLVGAGGVAEPFQLHVVGVEVALEHRGRAGVTVVLDALTQRIDEAVVGQRSGLAGDGGQLGDDLILQPVAVRGGGVVRVAVVDGGGAVVLAGVELVLADGLFKARDAGVVLGVERHVVQPFLSAVGRVGAVDGGHGQGDKEGIGGVGHHFRNLRFDDQIETQRQIQLLGKAMRIRFSKLGGVLRRHVALQSVFNGSRIGVQRRGERVDQRIALKEVIAGLGIGRRDGIGVGVGQTDCREQCAGVGVLELVQDHILVDAGSFSFIVSANVCDLQIRELDALDRVAVARLPVAEVVDGSVVQHRFECGVFDACGDVAVDHCGSGIVGVGAGQIILEDLDGADSGRINGKPAHGVRGNVHREREQDGDHHQDCAETLYGSFHFHIFLSFFIILVLGKQKARLLVRSIPAVVECRLIGRYGTDAHALTCSCQEARAHLPTKKDRWDRAP